MCYWRVPNGFVVRTTHWHVQLFDVNNYWKQKPNSVTDTKFKSYNMYGSFKDLTYIATTLNTLVVSRYKSNSRRATETVGYVDTHAPTFILFYISTVRWSRSWTGHRLQKKRKRKYVVCTQWVYIFSILQCCARVKYSFKCSGVNQNVFPVFVFRGVWGKGGREEVRVIKQISRLKVI